MTLLGVLGLLSVSAAVYAATLKPDFKLAVKPSSQLVVQGRTVNYKLAIKRVHGRESISVLFRE